MVGVGHKKWGEESQHLFSFSCPPLLFFLLGLPLPSYTASPSTQPKRKELSVQHRATCNLPAKHKELKY